MKDEYDFTGGERGKFYRPEAAFVPPVHLERDVLDFLSARAREKGESLDRLVNSLLRADIALIEAAG